ncbi:hypothetical protein ABW19_dt0208287 [Dactylella cylindrospora]|nr:hypothetical protein ABW19_dt0208287 [Dactylella cylindrospora]
MCSKCAEQNKKPVQSRSHARPSLAEAVRNVVRQPLRRTISFSTRTGQEQHLRSRIVAGLYRLQIIQNINNLGELNSRLISDSTTHEVPHSLTQISWESMKCVVRGAESCTGHFRCSFVLIVGRDLGPFKRVEANIGENFWNASRFILRSRLALGEQLW